MTSKVVRAFVLVLLVAVILATGCPPPLQVDDGDPAVWPALPPAAPPPDAAILSAHRPFLISGNLGLDHVGVLRNTVELTATLPSGFESEPDFSATWSTDGRGALMFPYGGDQRTARYTGDLNDSSRVRIMFSARRSAGTPPVTAEIEIIVLSAADPSGFRVFLIDAPPRAVRAENVVLQGRAEKGVPYYKLGWSSTCGGTFDPDEALRTVDGNVSTIWTAPDADEACLVVLTGTDAEGSLREAAGIIQVQNALPVIVLNGQDPAMVPAGAAGSYVDGGAAAADACGRPLTVTTGGTVDPTRPGTYIVTYDTTDAGGNAAEQATRTVIVQAQVAFEAAASSFSEAVANPPVNVELTFAGGGTTAAAIIVDIGDAGGGTATRGVDYIETPCAAIFPAGSASGALQGCSPITLVDDDIDEDDETINLVPSNVTGPAVLGSTTIHTLTILDDDTAGVTVTESGGSTSVTEGSATDTYTIVLDSEPTRNVMVTAQPDAELSVGNGAGMARVLTFTPANWNVAQMVTVTAVDDDVDECADPHAGLIAHAAASLDANYNAISVADVNADITDNDTAAVIIAESGGSTDVTEGGTSDSYTVVLATQPIDPVQIDVVPDAQVTVFPSSLTFTAANWNIPQSVLVTAVDDDLVEGSHTGTVTHTITGTDCRYGGLAVADVVANITDNDVPGVTINQPVNMTVAEGGVTSAYTLRLNTQPSANVTITVDPDDQLDVGAGQRTSIDLTFTPVNWNVWQAVTVEAFDDNVAEGFHQGVITHTAASADTAYNAIDINGVVVNILDNDTPGVTIATVLPFGPVDEADLTVTAEYTVVLDSEPAADVVISVTTDGQTEVSVDGMNWALQVVLTFTDADWNWPQTVEIRAVDDDAAEGPHRSVITNLVTSTDLNFSPAVIRVDGVPVITSAVVAVDVVDDDAAGVTIVQVNNPLEVQEGGATDTYTIELDSEPTADVFVSVLPDGELSVGSGAGVARVLTFTPANWNVPQTVMVTALDDVVDECADPHAGLIAHAAASLDGNYNAISVADVNADITDNDTAAVIIAESGGSTDVTEGGTSDSYTVVLATQPIDPVQIDVVPDAQVTVFPSSLTFTAANWNIPQSVLVTAVDDDVVEGPHTGTITHTIASTDCRYTPLLAVADVVANITDSDVPGVTINQPVNMTVTEGGSGSAYTVRLNTEPSADVTITVTPDAQLTALPLALTFTPANWDVWQTVNVEAVNDDVAEGFHQGIITHTTAGADLDYDGIAINDVVVNIFDNDTPGVTIATVVPFGPVDEADLTVTAEYTVVLDSEPAANVTVTATTDGQTEVSLAGGPWGLQVTLTFTAANWSDLQNVRIRAVDDDVAEGPHSSLITNVVASTDPNYNPAVIRVNGVPDITSALVVVGVVDNDTAGITIVQTNDPLDVSEGGAPDDYDIVLDSEPTADVFVSVLPDGELSVGSGAGVARMLTFTPANWNVAQTVTVTAVDDEVEECAVPHAGLLAHAAASLDPNYNAIPVADVNADITDNDTAAVIIAESGGSTDVTEGGTSDSYTVVLATQPIDPVQIDVVPDAQVTALPSSLMFTAANWNVPQSVLVTAVDDSVVEGAHTGTITHIITSTDCRYSLVGAANVVANITDNDVPGVTINQPVNMTVAEGGATSAYTLRLNTQPSANVTITVDPDNQLDVGAGQGTSIGLTFTPVNWSVWQTVTVEAFDDNVAEGFHQGIITHTAASADLDYNAIVINDVAVDILDNDIARLSITPTVDVSEADAALGGGFLDVTLDVTLDIASMQVVEVSFATADGTATVAGLDYEPTAGTLTFAPGTTGPETITVRVLDDDLFEGGPGTFETFFVNLASAVNATIQAGQAVIRIEDDEADPSLFINNVSLPEGDSGTTPFIFMVTLDPPSATPVTVVYETQDDTAIAGVDYIAASGTLTFAPGMTTNTILVAVLGNQIDQPDRTFNVVLSNQLPDPPVTITTAIGAGTIQDDDTAGVAILTVPPFAPVDEGELTEVSEYTVVLESEPTANVAVTADTDGQTEVSADGGGTWGLQAVLTFTSANWDSAQTVQIRAVDDAIAEGPHDSTISHTIASGDPNYNPGPATVDGAPTADVVVDVIEDDTAGLTISTVPPFDPVDGSDQTVVAEYEVVLDSEPTADVTVTATTDNETELSLDGVNWAFSRDLTFTSADWNAPQTVQIRAMIGSPGPDSTITHTVASADSNYDEPPPVPILVDGFPTNEVVVGVVP